MGGKVLYTLDRPSGKVSVALDRPSAKQLQKLGTHLQVLAMKLLKKHGTRSAIQRKRRGEVSRDSSADGACKKQNDQDPASCPRHVCYASRRIQVNIYCTLHIDITTREAFSFM